MSQLDQSCSPKEHTAQWILLFPQFHFHHAEDCSADRGNGATTLFKSCIGQSFAKDNWILSEPFKIQNVCS